MTLAQAIDAQTQKLTTAKTSLDTFLATYGVEAPDDLLSAIASITSKEAITPHMAKYIGEAHHKNGDETGYAGQIFLRLSLRASSFGLPILDNGVPVRQSKKCVWNDLCKFVTDTYADLRDHVTEADGARDGDYARVRYDENHWNYMFVYQYSGTNHAWEEYGWWNDILYDRDIGPIEAFELVDTKIPGLGKVLLMNLTTSRIDEDKYPDYVDETDYPTPPPDPFDPADCDRYWYKEGDDKDRRILLTAPALNNLNNLSYSGVYYCNFDSSQGTNPTGDNVERQAWRCDKSYTIILTNVIVTSGAQNPYGQGTVDVGYKFQRKDGSFNAWSDKYTGTIQIPFHVVDRAYL